MIDRRKNSEGYTDLTAYQAERNMERESGAKIKDCDREDLDYYVKKKVALLTNDFLCTPTEEEIAGLMKQPSTDAIDRYARHILKTHWEQEENE